VKTPATHLDLLNKCAEAPVVLDTTDQIATARLIVLKGAVRLETLGMKHSSGRKMWKVARTELKLSGRATIDDVYGALCKEVDKRLKRVPA